jgi:hypothetical protein
MMIKIYLNPALFAPGGFLEGQDSNRIGLITGTGRNDLYTAKMPPVFGPEHLSWRGGHHVWIIDSTGCYVDDVEFQSMKDFDTGRFSYITQIMDLVNRNIAIVEHNGVPMTALNIRDFVAV